MVDFQSLQDGRRRRQVSGARALQERGMVAGARPDNVQLQHRDRQDPETGAKANRLQEESYPEIPTTQ